MLAPVTYPMTILHRWICAGLAFATGVLLAPLAASAKVSAWSDGKGGTFRGEPAQVLGPFALFSGGGNGRRVLLRTLSDDECRRFFTEIAARPPRAATLAAAKGDATSDLVGRVLRVENRELVPADLTHTLEPELVLVLSGSHNEAEGWVMVSNLGPLDERVNRVFPGLMTTVFLGARHDAGQHHDMAVEASMHWLVADFAKQREMATLRRFVPAEGSSMVLVSREGVVLAGGRGTDVTTMRAFTDQVADFLWAINPENGASWGDVLHYLNATRPLQFATGHGDPVLVGNPLRAAGLRRHGIKRVAAKLAVDANGKVTPTLVSGPDDFPAELAPALSAALAQAVVAPAIDHGHAVAGELAYAIDVPPADPVRDADAVWLASAHYPTATIDRWLVLRPIPVPEKEFDSAIKSVGDDGKVEFQSFEVNSGKVSRAAQMSAFNSDWFTAAGADSVRPKEGDRQRIDGKVELTWEAVKSKDGFVDMQGGLVRDYVVGYAWTELTMPAATDAWLGLGSDDGVKIWLNGELVHDKWIRRQSRIDDDVVPLHLKQGANHILIKIQNATIDWSFIYRLRLKPGA